MHFDLCYIYNSTWVGRLCVPYFLNSARPTSSISFYLQYRWVTEFIDRKGAMLGEDRANLEAAAASVLVGGPSMV